MRCINEEIGHLLSLYEFGQLTEEKKKLFEDHLLECDFCFRSLHDLSPAVEEMRDHPETYLPALQEQPSIFETVKQGLAKVVVRGREAFEYLPAWGKVALPLGAIAVLLLMILQPSEQLSDLARIEPVPYRALQIKGGLGASEAERLFEEGMESYSVKQYDRAAEKLALAVEKSPDNVSFQFYLGLSYLLADKTDLAIQHFEKTIELGGNSLLEKAHWYLGNAYLLKGNGERALVEFRKVVEMEGDYEWEAREIIAEIEDKIK